jgi:hypothetical protein
MIPVPIPADYELAPFQRRVVIGPPDGDPTGDIRSVEAIVELLDDDHGRYQRFRVLVEVEPEDWKRWGLEPPARPARLWMMQLGSQMAPFAVESA